MKKSFFKKIYIISIFGISTLLMVTILPISYSFNTSELFILPTYQNAILPKLIVNNESPDKKVFIGEDADFSVSASVENSITGETLKYQWYTIDSTNLNGSPIQSQTSSSIKISTGGFPIGSKKYYCQLNYKNAPTVNSRIFDLNVIVKPIIKIQNIDDQYLISGNNAAFNVLANVENPIIGETLKYQWYATDSTNFNGSPIQNETSSSLVIDTSKLVEKINYYYCSVSYGNVALVNSNIAKLDVTPAASIKIINQPEHKNIVPGNPVSFSIKAEAANSNTILPSDFKYQWYYSPINSTANGQLIVGATSPTLAIEDTAIFISSTRWYYCVVSHSSLSSITSDLALLNTSNSFNEEGATSALNFWLSNKNNQKKVLETYFSNPTNAISMFKNKFSTNHHWIKALDSSLMSVEEVLANSIPNINFDTWKINLKVGASGGSYFKFVNGNWDENKYFVILPNSGISFYLPFSLTQNISLKLPIERPFENTINTSFKNSQESITSISWTSKSTPPEIFKFTLTEPGQTTFRIDTVLVYFSYPTFTSTNANLPIYNPYN